MSDHPSLWRQNSAVFDQQADEYDSWFDDSLLFAIELDALTSLTTPLAAPRVEIGAGPGRFAAALDVHFGLDPALAPLHLAANRGIVPVRAIGEQLPIMDGRVGTVFLLFTLCFVADPPRVLQECGRILQPGGNLVVGIIPGKSPWGIHLAAKGKAGNPYYRHARFHDPETVIAWLNDCGLTVAECRSTLRQPPRGLTDFEPSQAGMTAEAGFVVMVANKRGG